MKDKEAYKYLGFAAFSRLCNWSVQYLDGPCIRFTAKYPLVPIKEFLTRNKTAVAIQDDVKYKRVTIRVRNGGVLLRDEAMGENIGTKKQFAISSGQFILSKIDARNGAMGIVPQELDGAVITQDFLTYDIDVAKINPQYLLLVSTTKQFADFCQNCSSGTTNRQRIDENDFLNIKVPLPSLPEQNGLVEEYNRQLVLAANAESAASIKQGSINEIILDGLGIRISKKNWAGGLAFVPFSELSRWDAASFQYRVRIESSCRLVRMADCIGRFMADERGVSLRIMPCRHPAQEFRYIGMEHIEKATGRLVDMPVVKGGQIKSQAVRVPEGYYVYGKLRPYLNKYWHNDTSIGNIVCSSELFVFSLKKGIYPPYFECVLGSAIVQGQINDLVSGARMPRINEDVFMGIRLPMPPLDVQKGMVAQVERLKEEIKNLQQMSKACRAKAQAGFVSKILEGTWAESEKGR